MLNTINQNATPLYVVGANELREVFRDVVQEFNEQREQQQTALNAEKAKNERLLTAREVKAMLNVTDATLWRWNKTGYLPAVKIGQRIYYKPTDVERLKGGAL